jgi:WhiB family redox-sensing transcriptional regulator
VRVECLDYAIATNQDSGIWGGLDEEQRRSIRRLNAARQRAFA